MELEKAPKYSPQGFKFSLDEINRLTKRESLFLRMIDEDNNKVYLTKGKCLQAKLGYSYGDTLVFQIPDEKEVIERGNRKYFGQYQDDNVSLVFYSQIPVGE